MEALGFIETRSLTGAMDATDAMTKTAAVELVGTVKIGSGLVNVVVKGEVDAVKAAVAAGELSVFRRLPARAVRRAPARAGARSHDAGGRAIR